MSRVTFINKVDVPLVVIVKVVIEKKDNKRVRECGLSGIRAMVPLANDAETPS